MNGIPEGKSQEIKLAYGDFIASKPWDLYSTITFRQPRKDGLYWADRVWKVYNEKFSASRAVVAIEPHYLEGIHLHLLSCHEKIFPSDTLPNTSSLWKYCFKAFGRSRIERVDDALAVSRYCAKYVIKGMDLQFFGDAGAW